MARCFRIPERLYCNVTVPMLQSGGNSNREVLLESVKWVNEKSWGQSLSFPLTLLVCLYGSFVPSGSTVHYSACSGFEFASLSIAGKL